jgi:hypothetical protein
MSHCFTHSPCVCRDAQAKKSVADKITHPHAALSQADCMRMVKQLQDQLDEVCSLCSDLIVSYSVNVMWCDLTWCAVTCALAALAAVAVDVISVSST